MLAFNMGSSRACRVTVRFSRSAASGSARTE
jgi:hypothetical protein